MPGNIVYKLLIRCKIYYFHMFLQHEYILAILSFKYKIWNFVPNIISFYLALAMYI